MPASFRKLASVGLLVVLLAGCAGVDSGSAPPPTTLPPPVEVGELEGTDIEAVLTEVASARQWPHIAYTMEVLPTLDLELACLDEIAILATRGDEDSVVVLATGTLEGDPIEAYWLTSGIYLLAPDDACDRR